MMKKAKKGDTAAAAEIEKLRDAMLEYEVNIHSGLGIWADVMEDIDTLARKHFGSSGMKIGTMTTKYTEALGLYKDDVIATLKKTWFKEGAKATDNEFTLHMDRTMARVYLHLSPDTSAQDPLLSSFFMDIAWEELTKMEEGVKEVRSRLICVVDRKLKDRGHVGKQVV